MAGDAIKSNQFGRAVAVSGNVPNVVIIGAPYDDEGGENAGAVYVYRYSGSGWRQEARLKPATAGAYFGSAVALEANMAIIGAPFNDEDRFGRPDEALGSAYVYRWDGTTWQEHKKLSASDGTPGNRFGAAVSISGRFVIIGAPDRYGYSPDSSTGAAYVYLVD